MNKKITVWIFQTGEPLHSDEGCPRPMRAMNLANTLVNRGHNVILWSSDFYHQEKRHRTKIFSRIKINNQLEIQLIPSPGYKKHVGFFRLIDHFVLALNLKKKLKSQDSFPDVAFVGYPPIESAFVMTRWLKLKNIPFILDIKDQWPLIFVKRMPKIIRPIVRFIVSPYYLMAKKTMRNSTAISAMSDGFISWSLSFSKRSKSDLDCAIPLTSPNNPLSNQWLQEALNWWRLRGVTQCDVFRVMFVGSFSKAFDFDEIFKTLKLFDNKNYKCEFILCGDGELTDNLKHKAGQCDNIKIIEWIDHPKIVALSKISSAFIAPYINSSDFMMSVPNKIIDALKLGLPILSPLKGDVSALIKDNEVGLIYDECISLSGCIYSLINSKTMQNKMSINAKNLYSSDFEFSKVYGKLACQIEDMVIND